MLKPIIQEKLNQAVSLLKEQNIDCWITFVRETSAVHDPALDLLLGFGLTWDSAIIITRSGKKIAIAGRFDANNVRELEAYDEVIAYDLGHRRDPARAHQPAQPIQHRAELFAQRPRLRRIDLRNVCAPDADPVWHALRDQHRQFREHRAASARAQNVHRNRPHQGRDAHHRTGNMPIYSPSRCGA